MAKKQQYTYMDMIADARMLADGETIENTDLFLDKLDKYEASLLKKASTPRKKQAPKGASEKTLKGAKRLLDVLTKTPQTSAELAKALGDDDISPLTIANWAKYVTQVDETAQIIKSKVIREVVTKDGLKAERTYTAYALD